VGQRLRGNLDKIYAPGDVGLVFETGPESEEQAVGATHSNQYANLINSTAQDGIEELNGPYLGNSQQTHPARIPTNRHPEGRLNVVFADMHGATVRAVEYSTANYLKARLPSKYGPRVRVSPYNPHGLGRN
jgi:hypothetical protein